jgi:hypothetical protein
LENKFKRELLPDSIFIQGIHEEKLKEEMVARIFTYTFKPEDVA